MTDHPSTREAPETPPKREWPKGPPFTQEMIDDAVYAPSALPGVREPAERVTSFQAACILAAAEDRRAAGLAVEADTLFAIGNQYDAMVRDKTLWAEQSTANAKRMLEAEAALSTAHATAERLLEENAKLVESQTNWLRTAERYQQALEAAADALHDAGYWGAEGNARNVLASSLPASALPADTPTETAPATNQE